ncbi:MAG TPA: DUF5691 domain-containing protein [Bryobacteraceae bacterium]|nr:DUF5691 domain-containing protein [Bryobacteraceae bacterium]
MSLRPHLTTAVLLGSGQQPFEPAPSGSQLDDLLTQARDPDPAQRLLNSAALIVTYERAGALPVAAPRPPAPATDDPRPRCSPLAAGHLRTLLADRPTLLPEWLSLADAAGLRPPEELIPALLDAASDEPSLRDAVVKAGGSLSSWLAQFRAEWSWVASPAPDESIWQTGSLAERIAFLKQLRATEPGRCAPLLLACWSEEQADTRRQFVELLAANLSLGDEAFLEGVLDDRSTAVRRAAGELLATLPGSQLIERAKGRLTGRMRIARTGLLGRKIVVEVDPIESLDPTMLRDTIEKKPPSGSGLGERAWWTMQTIGAIPPGYWCAQFEMTPVEMIEAAQEGQWTELLLQAWEVAATRHRDLPWLDAFAREMEPGAASATILRAMPEEAREHAVLQLLHRKPAEWLMLLPDCCPHAWSTAFTEKFVALVSRCETKDPHGVLQYQLRSLLRAAARRASTQARWPEDSDIFADFTFVVAFRRNMRSALAPRN